MRSCARACVYVCMWVCLLVPARAHVMLPTLADQAEADDDVVEDAIKMTEVSFPSATDPDLDLDPSELTAAGAGYT